VRSAIGRRLPRGLTPAVLTTCGSFAFGLPLASLVRCAAVTARRLVVSGGFLHRAVRCLRPDALARAAGRFAFPARAPAWADLSNALSRQRIEPNLRRHGRCRRRGNRHFWRRVRSEHESRLRILGRATRGLWSLSERKRSAARRAAADRGPGAEDKARLNALRDAARVGFADIDAGRFRSSNRRPRSSATWPRLL
jgi:hypothetical protein